MTGILFATRMEAEPFLERGERKDCMVVVSGMGMAAARAATKELIEKHGVQAVINAGVCGSLKRRLSRGAVFRISQVSAEPGNTAFNVGIGTGLKKLVTVADPVFESERRRQLARQADLVDMEGFAVAEVCEQHGIPCILIKGVTDFGDASGKEDIQRHIAPVSEAVAAAVCRILDGTSCTGRTEQDAPSTLMQKLHSFTRIEHTVFSLPLLFAGAWLGSGSHCPPLQTLLLIACAGLGARTFGMAVNRILDKDLDGKNPRTMNRELPSGRLSMRQGGTVAAAGLAVYLVACALLGRTVLLLSPVPLVPLALYSLLKRFTPLCHYGIGLCLALAPLGAFVAAANSLAFTGPVLLLAVFTFCWMSGFDIIYALLDIEFDRAHGVYSLPAALGPARAQLVAAVTHLVAFAMLVMLWMTAGGVLAFAALLAAAGAFGAAYLPVIPVHARFFPVSAIAGIAGALVVLMGAYP